MKKTFLAIFAMAFSLHAAAPPRGSDQLRNLVVFPDMQVNFVFGLSSQGDDWVISKNVDLPSEISRLRGELKQQPNQIKKLLQLGYLLDSNNQTNESQSCYQKAEQLCRDKAAVNPQDGLNLTDLGEALDALDKDEEAESAYRKATLVSPNEWRCWVRLGNYLANEYFLMFPKDLRGQISPSSFIPSQAVLDYRPSPDALKKSEAQCNEASQCFDRAMAIAPQESEVLFQRAGYMSVSNRQNCFFRQFRDNEKIDPTTWILAFFSKETITNMQRAAELSPQNYEYISLAAYFEWSRAMIEWSKANSPVNLKSFAPDILPDATRRSLQGAMTRLETLSQSADKKLAAGALENLGMLNMFFGNSKVAAASFRQAVSLDPTREQSWDMWLGSIADSGTPEEKVEVCELRLKNQDSTRNHLLLARALQYQKKWDKAGEQTQSALKIEPDNFVALLELAALDLKQSADTNFMAKARERFILADEAYDKIPNSTEKQSRWRELTLDLAIMDALTDSPEYQKAARAAVDAVLQSFPNDETAKEISNALD